MACAPGTRRFARASNLVGATIASAPVSRGLGAFLAERGARPCRKIRDRALSSRRGGGLLDVSPGGAALSLSGHDGPPGYDRPPSLKTRQAAASSPCCRRPNVYSPRLPRAGDVMCNLPQCLAMARGPYGARVVPARCLEVTLRGGTVSAPPSRQARWRTLGCGRDDEVVAGHVISPRRPRPCGAPRRPSSEGTAPRTRPRAGRSRARIPPC